MAWGLRSEKEEKRNIIGSTRMDFRSTGRRFWTSCELLSNFSFSSLNTIYEMYLSGGFWFIVCITSQSGYTHKSQTLSFWEEGQGLLVSCVRTFLLIGNGCCNWNRLSFVPSLICKRETRRKMCLSLQFSLLHPAFELSLSLFILSLQNLFHYVVARVVGRWSLVWLKKTPLEESNFHVNIHFHA